MEEARWLYSWTYIVVHVQCDRQDGGQRSWPKKSRTKQLDAKEW